MSDIFGARRDIRLAFEQSAKQPKLGCPYRVIGEGKTVPVTLTPEAGSAVVHSFLDLLLAWNAHRAAAGRTVEGEYSSNYADVKVVRITKTGGTYKIRWDLASGSHWIGVGLLNKQGDTLTVASAVSTGSDDQYVDGSLHVAVFRVEYEGDSVARLISDCARYGENGVHNETLTPKRN